MPAMSLAEYKGREALVLQENSELTELFDLESSGELLERFACALLQTYSCSHNKFTPEQQVCHCFRHI